MPWSQGTGNACEVRVPVHGPADLDPVVADLLRSSAVVLDIDGAKLSSTALVAAWNEGQRQAEHRGLQYRSMVALMFAAPTGFWL